MKHIYSLCIIEQDGAVLLGLKKRGFGSGKWNGFGGKITGAETIEQGARREVLEECGVEPGKMEKMGVLEFSFEGQSEILETHVYRMLSFSGTPRETEEMRPQWFAVSEIPFNLMWPDDRYWMPLFLEGKKFTGEFRFGEGEVITRQVLLEVAEL